MGIIVREVVGLIQLMESVGGKINKFREIKLHQMNKQNSK
jgi:hypothetical protein